MPSTASDTGVLRMWSKDLRCYPGVLEGPGASRRGKRVGGRVVSLALAAAVGLTACSASAETPAEETTATASVEAGDPNATDVATGFLEAYGAFDADQAITYLADDADLSGMGAEGTREFQLLVSLLEAQGYKQMLDPCEQLGSTDTETTIRCTFDFHGIRSDEIGRGPFTGSYFDITVSDGKVVTARLYWETSEFSRAMWEPFAKWVSKVHPEDGPAMYEDDYQAFRLSNESVRLWDQRTREYVEEQLAR